MSRFFYLYVCNLAGSLKLTCRIQVIILWPHTDTNSKQYNRGIVAFNFSPRNLTQVTSDMKPVQDSMVGFSSVKRITLREGLY